MRIRIKKNSIMATLPTRGSEEAAGYDLYANIPEGQISILPHETEMVDTGVSLEIPSGYFGGIYARSGLARKENLRPANCVGIVDSDYRGPVMVAMHNDSEKIRFVEHGERVAQLVIQPYLSVEFEEADELGETERGAGGFGSTGK